MSELSDRLRREFAAGDMVRDAGLSTPEDIERYDDLCYGEDKSFNILDVYRLKEKKGELLPVIAIIHGGAWVYGDKGVYQYYAMSLAQRGFAVVNFSYRLAPENRFPAQLEDICAVFRWMEANQERYGLDVKNVFAVGDSAGAHLLGLFAAICSNPEYLGRLSEKYKDADFSLPEQPSRLNAIALNCGKYDLARENEEDKDTREIVKDFFVNGGDEDEFRLANVTTWITGDYPPVFMMTCPGDFLKYQAPYMMETLMDKDVPFAFRFYGNADNPLTHVFHCNVRLEDGRICNDDECAFFKRYIVSV